MQVLVVDDDSEFRDTTARRLRRQGHEVRSAEDGRSAVRAVSGEAFDVVLTDLVMPGLNGMMLLDEVKRLDPECEVVLLTGEATVETAVAAMKRGAFDYVTKPAHFDELLALLERAAERRQLANENVRLKVALSHATPEARLVGESATIKDVLRLIRRAAPTNSPVLILGESGTGKELVARAVHALSPRADRPLVTINCAALQETLLESELFGHEKGAFTGATETKLGLFEVADGGTLFVDEVGELAGGLQAKLLRVLEDGSLRRVGSTRERKVDVRVVAATNRSLAAEVEEGRFRDDLFYRINVLSIELPSLRDRRDDIPLLVEHFLRTRPSGPKEIEDEAMALLKRHHWPGNVRELANVVERASILVDGDVIRRSDLVESLDRGPTIRGRGEPDDLAEREKLHVRRILERERWRKAEAARVLGITRRSLYRLIEKYDLREEDE